MTDFGLNPKLAAAPSAQLKSFEIDYRDLEEMKPIGKGSSGVIFSARWRQTQVAVKELKSSLLIHDSQAFTDFQSEANILASLRPHPNVILFLGITSPPQPTTIITEYCANGSLYQLLQYLLPDRSFTFLVLRNPSTKIYKLKSSMELRKECSIYTAKILFTVIW